MKTKKESLMLVPIKEFSDFTGVKESVLRYYDDIGLFSPETRGENNYRYYSLSQIQTIKLIETLRELNIPLKRIQEFMKTRSPETAVEMLSRREAVLNAELRTLQESFSLIHSLRSLIQSGISKDTNTFEIVFEDEQRISIGPENEFYPNESYYRAYSNFYRTARNNRINLGYHIGGYYDNVSEYFEKPYNPMHFYSLDPNGIDIKEAGTYLSGYAHGDYGAENDLAQCMKEYIEIHNLKPVGPVYHVYPLNEVCFKEPEKYLSRISVRVEKGKPIF